MGLASTRASIAQTMDDALVRCVLQPQSIETTQCYATGKAYLANPGPQASAARLPHDDRIYVPARFLDGQIRAGYFMDDAKIP
jgi:hypothetical protein